MRFLDTYFDAGQISLLAVSLLIYLSSIITFSYTEKKTASIVLLIAATLCLGLFAITLDPYLNTWDEQFHALVAKNLSHNFFKPILYSDPVLPYDKNIWTENYIWLHKQPFFLWQMALSIKIFGPTVYAIRAPSLICFTFATFCTYRIGKNLVNESVGFLSALLYGSNCFFLELLSGGVPTDHNDIVFITYITASIWAFTEHTKNTAEKKWIYLNGIFAGVAVLTKWLVGLLVYAGWFIYLAFERRELIAKISDYKHLALSLIISAVIVIPWQIYIITAFPEEASYEYKLSSTHFNHVVENHGGDAFFYFDSLSRNFGYFFPLLCFGGLILLNKYSKNRNLYVTSLSMIVIVFSFFTMAATKMDGFILVVSSLLFVAVAVLIYSIFMSVKHFTFQKSVFVVLSIIGLAFNLNPERIQLHHTFWKNDYEHYYERYKKCDWKNVCETLRQKLTDEKWVVFNCQSVYGNISLMFYTDYLGYNGLPKKEDFQSIKNKGYKIAVIDDGFLPANIVNNSEIEIISSPAYKAFKTDTVYIKSEHFAYLSMFGEQVICNDSLDKERYTITHFEDSTCCIRNSHGAFASLDYYNWKGRVIFKKKSPTITERFKLEPINNDIYKIKTADNTTLKAVEGGKAICADNRAEWTEDKFLITGMR